VPAAIKKIVFFAVFFSIFELGGITKHFLTDSTGNREFCTPTPPPTNVPLGFASENIEDLRETKLTVSLGTSH